jgi:V8-like Glu-specific endopeptidase
MRLILAALLSVGLAAAAAAQNLRVLDTPGEIFGLEAVGRLDAEMDGRRGFCTATLITPARVLTAAHCLVGEDGALVAPEALTFRAGLRNGQTKGARGVARYAIHPDYRPGRSLSIETIAVDLALLELDQPVDYWAVPPLRARGGIETGQSVQVVSYARGREAAPSHEEGCSVLSRSGSGRVLGLNCQATFGSSGAPVFVATSRGPRVVAVISSGGTWRNRPITYAASVTDVLPLLDAAMPRIGAPRRIASPGVKTLRPGEGAGQGGTIRFIRPEGG